MKRTTLFEDLGCWNNSREPVRLVYEECDQGILAEGFVTKRQLKRAVLSIMKNIAESFARNSNKEFIRLLEY